MKKGNFRNINSLDSLENDREDYPVVKVRISGWADEIVTSELNGYPYQ